MKATFELLEKTLKGLENSYTTQFEEILTELEIVRKENQEIKQNYNRILDYLATLTTLFEENKKLMKALGIE